MRTYVYVNFHLNFLNISKCINDVFQNKEKKCTQEAKQHLPTRIKYQKSALWPLQREILS
jgi:hypothetical protein